MTEINRQKLNQQIEVALIGLALLIITYLHFRWIHYAPYGYNIVLQFLYYVPVIYAAVRFGVKGAVLAALAATTAYGVHLLGHGLTMDQYVNHLLQIVFINLIGWVTGALSHRERAVTEQYRELADKQKLLIAELEESHRNLATVNYELAQEIAERKVLEETVRRSERLSAMGHLAAGVAHEMRNPLGIIRATMQVMEGEQKNNPEISEFSRVIKEECDRMNAVIEEFLQFARPAEPSFEAVNFGDLLDEVLLFTGKYITGQGIEFIRKVPLELPQVMGDPGQIKQVLINLIINAVEAMPHGGKLAVTAREQQEQIEISVRDNGLGISEDSLSQIFDPFYSTKTTGTGLGLSIVYRIMENHHGTMRVKSKPQEGSEFILTLPKAGEYNG